MSLIHNWQEVKETSRQANEFLIVFTFLDAGTQKNITKRAKIDSDRLAKALWDLDNEKKVTSVVVSTLENKILLQYQKNVDIKRPTGDSISIRSWNEKGQEWKDRQLTLLEMEIEHYNIGDSQSENP